MHVCLAGPSVCDHWDLIRRLKEDHTVTLVESFDVARLAKEPVMKVVGLLVLDCGKVHGAVGEISKMIGRLRKTRSDLIVVLIDGQIDRAEVARAFAQGARDYFPEPCDWALLGQRIQALCRPRRQRNSR